jgi:hypothetical protein
MHRLLQRIATQPKLQIYVMYPEKIWTFKSTDTVNIHVELTDHQSL